MAPDAILAIHDAHYPSRPATYAEMRWRLLYLFEERIGRKISEAKLAMQDREDAAFERARELLS